MSLPLTIYKFKAVDRLVKHLKLLSILLYADRINKVAIFI